MMNSAGLFQNNNHNQIGVLEALDAMIDLANVEAATPFQKQRFAAARDTLGVSANGKMASPV